MTAGDGVDPAELSARVLEALLERTGTGIDIDIEVVRARELPCSDGKAARVVDHRDG